MVFCSLAFCSVVLSPPACLSPPPLFSVVFCSVVLSPPACLSPPLLPPPLFSAVSVSVVERSVLSTVKVCWETVVTVWLVAVSLW